MTLWIKHGIILNCHFTHGKGGVDIVRFQGEPDADGKYLYIDLRPEDIIALARSFAPRLIDTYAAKEHLNREGFVVRKKRFYE